MCCSPWCHKELDMTERLNWTGAGGRDRFIILYLNKKKDKQKVDHGGKKQVKQTKSWSWWKEAGKAMYQIWKPVWWVPWLLAVCKSKLLLWEQSEAVSKKTFSSVRTVWVREDILIFLLLQPSTEQIKYLFPCDMVDISKSISGSQWILCCRYWFHEVQLCWVFKTKQLDIMNALCVCVCALNISYCLWPHGLQPWTRWL